MLMHTAIVLLGVAATAALAQPAAPLPTDVALDLAPGRVVGFAEAALAAPRGDHKASRLDTALDLLADLAATRAGKSLRLDDAAVTGGAIASALATRELRVDASAETVQVYVVASKSLTRAEAAVRKVGGRLERRDDVRRLVQAWVPVSRLRDLADQPGVARVRRPNYGHRSAGSLQTEGDAILNADQVRSSFGVNGAGVKVGLTSDGVAGLPQAQASGDLGTVDTTSCNVVPGSNPQQPGRAEGTAMLEIVHDIAPGAQLMFGNWNFGTDLDFNAAIDCLAQKNDVVVDDIAFFLDGPYDGTGVVSANTSAELNRTSNKIRLYSTSVGNQAEDHYQEDFLLAGNLQIGPINYQVHRFMATGNTTDAGFNKGCGGVFCTNSVQLASGESVRVFLAWNDPFGGSANDYDVFLLDPSGLVVATSDDAQTGSQDPVEGLSFTNGGAAQTFDILIGRLPGAATRNLDVFILGGDKNFITRASSVPNQADAAGGVISVGAIRASDPGADTIEFFSSRGPTNDGRIKPDVTAIDGVSVTGSGGFSNPFFGTSAASPHVAGIAALLLQVQPSLKSGDAGDNPAADRTALRNAVLDTAVDLGSAGTDNTFGTGRADALIAAQSLGSVVSSCTPDATTLCIDSNTVGDRRFKAKATFRSSAGAAFSNAKAVATNSIGINKGGIMAFTDSANPEILIKVLNGCGLNSRYWVFYAATTNQQLELTVTDTKTNAVRTYTNPLGVAALPVQDTSAFATCP
jgi:hypothetical protein